MCKTILWTLGTNSDRHNDETHRPSLDWSLKDRKVCWCVCIICQVVDFFFSEKRGTNTTHYCRWRRRREFLVARCRPEKMVGALAIIAGISQSAADAAAAPCRVVVLAVDRSARSSRQQNDRRMWRVNTNLIIIIVLSVSLSLLSASSFIQFYLGKLFNPHPTLPLLFWFHGWEVVVVVDVEIRVLIPLS